MSVKEAREVEFEVLGKNEPRQPARTDDPFIALVSRLMDTVFTIPGTNIRFGLDPILGLLPTFGDTASAIVSTLLILQSAKYGVPRVILARMTLNVLLNTAIGAIPVLGDIFSVWFKSNARNYDLLRRHASTRKAATWGDWVFVVGLLALILGAVVLMIAGAVALLSAIFNRGA